MRQSKSQFQNQEGFSLVETLTVVGIIALLAGLGSVVAFRSDRPIEAAQIASQMAELARVEAQRAGSRSRVAICVDANADDYLQQAVVVVDRDGDLESDDWQILSKRLLPGNTVFWTEYSAPLTGELSDSEMSLDADELSVQTGGAGDKYQFIEFNSIGRCDKSTQWVFTLGDIDNGEVQILRDENRDGFIIRKTGKTAFFTSPEQISLPN